MGENRNKNTLNHVFGKWWPQNTPILAIKHCQNPILGDENLMFMSIKLGDWGPDRGNEREVGTHTCWGGEWSGERPKETPKKLKRILAKLVPARVNADRPHIRTEDSALSQT